MRLVLEYYDEWTHEIWTKCKSDRERERKDWELRLKTLGGCHTIWILWKWENEWLNINGEMEFFKCGFSLSYFSYLFSIFSYNFSYVMLFIWPEPMAQSREPKP